MEPQSTKAAKGRKEEGIFLPQKGAKTRKKVSLGDGVEIAPLRRRNRFRGFHYQQ